MTETYATNDIAQPIPSKNSVGTRVFHGALAVTIVTQLATSQFMPGPDEAAGAWIFNLHQYSGLVAAALAFGFWITLMLRRKGTSFAALFLWFSGRRLGALARDIKVHLSSLMKLRLPAHDPDAARPLLCMALGCC